MAGSVPAAAGVALDVVFCVRQPLEVAFQSGAWSMDIQLESSSQMGRCGRAESPRAKMWSSSRLSAGRFPPPGPTKSSLTKSTFHLAN